LRFFKANKKSPYSKDLYTKIVLFKIWRRSTLNKKILAIGITILFIFVVFTPSMCAYKYYLKPIINKIPFNDSDLISWGEPNWTNVEPGETVHGRFTIYNFGRYDTLYWEIIEWPDWGIWDFGTFFPKLPPRGTWIVFVNLIAPYQGNESFFGQIKVVNKNNANDYGIINASLTTCTVDYYQIKKEIIEDYY